MWLLLCNVQDTSVLWAYRGLRSRGLEPVEVVSAESLVYSISIEHRIATNNFGTRITLVDGREVNSASVRGTLNRIHTLPSKHLRAADPADRQYAEQELYALFLSWLYALPGTMLNRPAPGGLCGAWQSQSKWHWLASQSGLTTNEYRQGAMIPEKMPYLFPNTFARTVIVVAGHCFGAVVSEQVRRGCTQLAQSCGVEILGIEFQVGDGGEWIFSRATPLPEIRAGGEPLLDALFDIFTK